MKKLLSLAAVVLTLSACNKNKYVVEYSVKCGTCTISYWDENTEFIERLPAAGNWKYSFEATQDNRISVAAQSQLCLDTAACNDTLQLLADSVFVSIKVDGNTQKSASAGNKPFAAAWAEIFLD